MRKLDQTALLEEFDLGINYDQTLLLQTFFFSLFEFHETLN